MFFKDLTFSSIIFQWCSCQNSLSPKVFWCFQGNQKRTLGNAFSIFSGFAVSFYQTTSHCFFHCVFFLRKNLSCKANNKNNKNIFRIFCQFFSKLTIKPSEQHSNNLFCMNNFVDKFNLVNKFVQILRICYLIILGLLLSDYLMNGKENTM